jgi:hypothetical protein
MKHIAICAMTALTLLAGSAHAQTNASSVNSSDPVVQTRMKKKDANEVYKKSVAAAGKERDAKIKAAVDSAVADAQKTGKDPIVARRNATSEAKKMTKADYDAAVSAAKKQRDTAYAAAGPKPTTTAAKP